MIVTCWQMWGYEKGTSSLLLVGKSVLMIVRTVHAYNELTALIMTWHKGLENSYTLSQIIFGEDLVTNFLFVKFLISNNPSFQIPALIWVIVHVSKYFYKKNSCLHIWVGPYHSVLGGVAAQLWCSSSRFKSKTYSKVDCAQIGVERLWWSFYLVSLSPYNILHHTG